MNTPRSRNWNATDPQSAPSSAISAPSTATVDNDALLKSLNPAQLQAVKHDPSVPLQILAGPGSGKTKVLTSRIARLILTHKLEPSSICAVTFTNKAANEMRERLTKLIGKTRTTALQMGTFHSLCARFLRRYSNSVGLDTNFTICDAEDSKKLINEILKAYKEYMIENDIAMTDGSASSVISKAKAKGQSAAMFFQEVEASEKSHKHLGNKDSPIPAPEQKKSIKRILAEVYIGYETILKQNNALDFDDLLIYGVKLFSNHKEAVLWCNHILVDEFQDTNTMQYELMTAIAIRRCVTIVGDPDQSIYGWRSAEVVNLSRMRKDFSPVQQIFLEQNYRSTASILRSCLAIVAEDKKRISKSLNTSHPLGATPFIGAFDSEKDEAAFIASEIKRCVANMGGVLKWGDFVILLRFNALSRPIESALQKEGIPCRILGGHKFFERMEVKDILSHLQLVDNPNFNPAFLRAIKVPTRGTGDKTLLELASQAEKLKLPQLQLIETIYDNKISDIKPPIKRKITSFVKTIRTLRKLDEENKPPSEIIRKLVEMINYEDHLRKTQQDWESRWENVQELITFASEVEVEVPAGNEQSNLSATDDQITPQANSIKQDSMLRQFLQSSMLSSEGDNQSEEESKEKVTLSTCHSAKGLEWPVVVIPSVDQDTFPFYRTQDIEEERRLLYVACTRAQSLLYLLHSRKRQVAGKTKEKSLSSFVSVVRGKNEGLFSYDVPRFLPEDRAVVSEVLSRPVPKEAEIKRRLAELDTSGERVQPVFQNSNGGFSAVSLTGVKSSLGAEVNMYASADALASISASFRKDYKKSPFTGARQSFPKERNLKDSFVSASAAGYMHPQQSRTTPYSSNMTYDPRIHLNPQVAESSRHGPKPMRPSAQSTPHLRMHQTNLPAIHLNPVDLTVNEPCFPSAMHSESEQSLHPSTFAYEPPPTRSPYAKQVINLVSPNKHSKLPTPVSKTSQRSPVIGYVPITSLHVSKRQGIMTGSSGPRSSNGIYQSSRPSDKRPIYESGSHSHPDILGDIDTNCSTMTVKSVASTVVSSAHSLSCNQCPSVVTELPTMTKTPRPQTETLGVSLERGLMVPQTAGIKRRLGMGRSTAGYSNKKVQTSDVK